MPDPGKEFANLYMRGVNEASAGEVLDATEILAVLDVFGEEGLRWYMIGVLEGLEGLEEEMEELAASAAFCVNESQVSILKETEDVLQVYVECAPADLEPSLDVHIIDDGEEILESGRITKIEFGETQPERQEEQAEAPPAGKEPQELPATITADRWRYEIVEYEDPDDFPKE